MGNRKIVGVILAAGRGARMAPFSDNFPKPILPICNKPLLVYQIESMREIGIEEIIIVVGHKAYEITRILGSGEKFGVKIQYVDQESTLGIAHAVGKLEGLVKTPFLLFLGDIFFRTSDLRVMVDMMLEESATGVLAVKVEEDPEAIKRNFAIILNEDRTVRRVIEKPRYTQNKLKGCGLYLFDLPIFDAIRRTPRTAMRDEYEITDSIQLLIDDFPPVKVAEVVEWDVNLTSPIDLLRINLYQLERIGRNTLIGKDTEIHPDAELSKTVVGDGARIENPISLSNCVIFNGTIVTTESSSDGVIFTPDSTIDCRNIS
ncbi:MAG: sugar phosphate nucleotidyltransferase [Candidatus Glassbacteria bacterium]